MKIVVITIYEGITEHTVTEIADRAFEAIGHKVGPLTVAKMKDDFFKGDLVKHSSVNPMNPQEAAATTLRLYK